MGTPDFAVPTLKALIDSTHELVGVVTQPDRPKGRGQEIQLPPVKKIGLEAGLKVFQPENPNLDRFIREIRLLRSDLVVVAAYGKILSSELLEVPKWFCMNLHASLLPKYRGAAPIHWALINGDRQTGITTMKMDQGLDTGDMLLKQKVSIEDSDNSQTLHDKLAEAGGLLVLKTIETLLAGRLILTEQNPNEASHAPKLKKEHGLIRWDQNAKSIHNWVRGLTPWPGAYTFYRGQRWIISKTETNSGKPNEIPGKIIRISDHGLEIGTGEGRLMITELKPEGKRSMSAKHFIQGHKVETGVQFDTWTARTTTN